MVYDVCLWTSLQHIIDNKCYVLKGSNLIFKFKSKLNKILFSC